MANGWRAYGHSYGSPTVVKTGTLCMVSGLLRGSKWGHVMATLPSGCRPKGRLIFNMNHNESTIRVVVLANGQVLYVKGRVPGVIDFLPLDGIRFCCED